MSDRPTNASSAGRAYLALRKRALMERRSTQELQQQYALEGFLVRLSMAPPTAPVCVLKGGTLLAAYAMRRPTRDVDLVAYGLGNDAPSVRAFVARLLSLSHDDGLVFGTLTSEVIRDDAAYSGVRVTVPCSLATANVSFHVDVSVGDAVWPAPIRVAVPRLLGGEISLLGYSLAMVVAEKVVTAMQRKGTNTRWRDFADVYWIGCQHALLADELGGALATVAKARDVELIPLALALQGLRAPGQQEKWAAWVRKLGLGERVPRDLAEVLVSVQVFVDPLLEHPPARGRWDPERARWG